MPFRLLLPCLACLVAIFAPAEANAQACQAPPGTAAVEQYCESVPSAAGSRGEGDSDDGSTSRSNTGANPPPAPAETQQELEQAGEDGRQLSALLNGGGPSGGSAGRGTDTGASGSTTADRDGVGRPAPGFDPLEGVESALTSGSSTGAWLGGGLLGLTLALVAMAWVARTRRTP